MQDMGEGRKTGKVKASGAKKDGVCVRAHVCQCVCVRESMCVCAYMSSLGPPYPVYVCMFL